MKKNEQIAITLLAVLLQTTTALAQHKSEIPVLTGEKWWGAFTALGNMMPLSEKNTGPYSLGSNNEQNQAVPFLVSNYGRYIWSETPFDFTFDGAKISIDSPTGGVQVVKAGKNLREAFILGKNAHFKSDGQLPPALFFSRPQYNTWIELQYDQNQADIEKYAADLLANGFPAGILMVDDNWQRYYGNFDFKAERFPDPKGMIDRLHGKGFKVMLWISPFVSPDSPEFREAQAAGYLIRQKGSDKAALIPWWNGFSACYDLTNPKAFDHLRQTLKRLQDEYGVDGFKFDAGDTYFYNPQTQDYYDTTARAVDHLRKWAELGTHFPYNEYRACWGMQGYPLVQRLSDKNNSWDALRTLIPEMLNAGIMGYPYTCPDMVGGGQVADFSAEAQEQLDQDLIVRSAQLQAMMPMMQFSVAPWRVLDKEHLGYCLAAARLHEKMAPYILETARQAALTGEPIVRYMEYMYPKNGFSDCRDQYMLGAKYLVAPILTPDGKRTVRLPRGVWVDDLGQRFKGPLVIEVSAPTGRIPYYELKR
ncbi:glycoside hydrolase family 31 protein [uncultured Rikenella sp.]|uniref:glycoside hydrolase family 31 protein n=1 Tax=uncultured Rikenella sp. TaxID=368003 RepID=UPI0026104E77|nr:glycoside hydrolase family 31 protein [uncultured Rikenella sp.]